MEIDEYDIGQNTGKLVIQLPNDDESRAAVLQIVNTLAQKQGFDPETDRGQQYLFLMLD